MKTRLLNAGRLPPALDAGLAQAYDYVTLPPPAERPAFLVNVARGTVIDEAALISALSEKRIAGAGLDVYEDEPHVPSALMTLDNVVLMPHIASATRETRQAMADRVFDNLQSFFADGRLVSAAP